MRRPGCVVRLCELRTIFVSSLENVLVKSFSFAPEKDLLKYGRLVILVILVLKRFVYEMLKGELQNRLGRATFWPCRNGRRIGQKIVYAPTSEVRDTYISVTRNDLSQFQSDLLFKPHLGLLHVLLDVRSFLLVSLAGRGMPARFNPFLEIAF